MSYDQNRNYYGSQPDPDEDQWLEDIKSLLDDGPSSGAYGEQDRTVSSRNRYPEPDWENPDQQPFERQNPRAFNQWQEPRAAEQDFNFYARTQGFDEPFSQAPAAVEERPQKKSYAAVIVLSLIIVLEVAAIAAVAYSWISWMR